MPKPWKPSRKAVEAANDEFGQHFWKDKLTTRQVLRRVMIAGAKIDGVRKCSVLAHRVDGVGK